MTEPTADTTPDLGVFARAIGIITSPTDTFKSVVKAPRPAIILLLVAFLMGLAVAAPQFTERGKQAALDMQVQQTERIMGQQVTPEVYAAIEGRMKYSPYIAFVSTFIVLPIGTLLFSVIYWGIFNVVMAGTATVKQVLGVVAHSQVIAVLGLLAGAPIQYIKGTADQVGPFNLGALVPMLEPTHPLAKILGLIGFFSLWGFIVTAIGLGVLYKRKPTGIAVALIVVYVGIISGLVFMFPSMMGR